MLTYTVYTVYSLLPFKLIVFNNINYYGIMRLILPNVMNILGKKLRNTCICCCFFQNS